MQTLQQIRELLEQAGLAPQKRFGQNFLFDQNLMLKLLELADLRGEETVLEVGPGTGSLTEELLKRALRVVAVEIDNGLYQLLASRLGGNPKLTLLHTDALAGKHAIAPAVLDALGPRATLVANLPYNVATPLVAQCLVSSWESLKLPEPTPEGAATPTKRTRFDRLVFTVQQEVAERLVATEGSGEYGPVSILIALLGNASFGHAVPNTSFWPKPQIVSRMVRIDFDPQRAGELTDVWALKAALLLCFTQRRKQIGSVMRRKNAAFAPEDFEAALDRAQIDRTTRPEQVSPAQFGRLANALAGKMKKLPFAAAGAESDADPE